MADLVTIAEAVEQTGYSKSHIRLLLRQNLIKGRKAGGVWLADLDDLKRYEKEMKELGDKKFDPTRGE
jgi:hypothetical protein